MRTRDAQDGTGRVVFAPRELAASARTWARRCPLTATYLLLLVVIAVLLTLLPNEVASKVVSHASTNLQGLRDKPLFVLVASAFVLSGGLAGLLWLPLLAVVMGAVERWLGRLATVLVFALGHVGATLGLAVMLVSGIAHRAIGPEIATVHDVGVSYGLLAMAGTLTARVPSRWRARYAATIAGFSLGAFAISREPTEAGHALAAMIGLALAVVLLRAVAAATRSDGLSEAEGL
jgi:rhomboid family protein